MAELYTYTGSRIALQVKEKFGDVGNAQINDEMILGWINNGIRAIMAQAPFLQATASTNLLAGIAAYQLSTAFPDARIHSYESVVVNGRPVKVVPFSEYQGLVEAAGIAENAGAPRYATEFGDTITFWPVPDETIANGIVLYYNAYPADIAAITDTLTVPDRFYNALNDFVLAQALELDENFEASAVKLGHHEVNLQRQFEQESKSPTNFYPTVTMDPDDEGIY